MEYLNQYQRAYNTILNPKEEIAFLMEKQNSPFKDDSGVDYDYQIRHNPFLKTPDFYNIKPYDLLIEELKKGTP